MVLSVQEIQNLYPKIKNCDLFRHLDKEEIVSLFQGLHLNIKSVPKGKLFSQRGERLECLMVLLEGALSADILNLEGQVLKVETLQSPSLIAAGLLFADQNYLPVQLTAISPSKIMEIPREDLLILAGKDTRILEKLLTESGNKIHFLAEKLRFMQIGTIEKKLCSYIWEQSQLQRNDLIKLPYSIQGLSELFGISRPSLSRSLGLLVDEGLISKEGKYIKILQANQIHERCLA